MIRSCIASAWKVLTSTQIHIYSHAKTFNSPVILKPSKQWISYFSRPFTLEPTIRKFLLPPGGLELNEKRSLTKFSLKKGKRKAVKAVIKRFYRLDWGIWIRTKCGRHKKLYKKSAKRKRRLRRHVFTNGTQSYLLDKMVTKFWRKRRFYVDDPYEPYHRREEFTITRKRPSLPWSQI